MKQFILITFLFMLVVNNITATTTIDLYKDPQYPGPKPHSFSYNYIPAGATINEEDLSVYFDSSLVTATIKVCYAFNQMIALEVVDVTVTTVAYTLV